jgi:Resolvase, N terminal domain
VEQIRLTKLDRLARSVSDAHDIAKELTARDVKLNLGGSIHDPTDATGKLLFTTRPLRSFQRKNTDSAGQRRCCGLGRRPLRVGRLPALTLLFRRLLPVGLGPVCVAAGLLLREDAPAAGRAEGIELALQLLPAGGHPGVADIEGRSGGSAGSKPSRGKGLSENTTSTGTSK